MPQFDHLNISLSGKVAEISLNRPDRANALDEKTWFDLGSAFTWADQTPEVRVVILRGEGPHFCSGIDFQFVAAIASRIEPLPDGRKQEFLLAFIRSMQRSFTTLETCRKPVIAAIQGGCYGGGIDLTSACDIRHASRDSKFSVKEVDLGIVADIGTLQRLPRLVGEGIAREWSLTGRIIEADEACSAGFVNHISPDYQSLLAAVREQAALIAEKSPLAVRGTKQILNYSRDHSVADSLDYVAAWNAGMLVSTDLALSLAAMKTRQKPEYPD